MFQKNSFSVPSDSSGIFLVKVIQARRCTSRNHAKIGKFLKVVIKKTKTRFRKLRKKKSRSIVIRTSHSICHYKQNIYYFFKDNALVLLKKRMNCRGRELIGPTSYDLKIKKFRIAFKYIY